MFYLGVCRVTKACTACSHHQELDTLLQISSSSWTASFSEENLSFYVPCAALCSQQELEKGSSCYAPMSPRRHDVAARVATPVSLVTSPNDSSSTSSASASCYLNNTRSVTGHSTCCQLAAAPDEAAGLLPAAGNTPVDAAASGSAVSVSGSRRHEPSIRGAQLPAPPAVTAPRTPALAPDMQRQSASCASQGPAAAPRQSALQQTTSESFSWKRTT